MDRRRRPVATLVHPSDFFYEMELRHQAFPGRILRKDYVPIFIVDLLYDQLKAEDENSSCMREPTTSLGCTHSQSFSDNPDTHSDGNFLILSADKKRFIKALLNFARIVKGTPGIGYVETDLMEHFCSRIEYPALELIWLVTCSKNKIFGLSEYLMRLHSKFEKKFLISQVVDFCFSWHLLFGDSTNRKPTKILQDFLPEIIVGAYCNAGSNGKLANIKKICQQILAEINGRLCSSDETACPFMTRHFLLSIFQGVPLPNLIRGKYFSALLKQVLCENTEGLSVDHVRRQQEKFAERAVDAEHPGRYETLSFLVRESSNLKEEILSMAQKCIRSGNINWGTLLILTTILGKVEEERHSTTKVFPLLKEIIRELIVSGLSGKLEVEISAAFVLARHCSLISPEKFSRYVQWYVRAFGNETTSPANTPESFAYLAAVLSSWVPDEPICFLQVHATYWPYFPRGMRSVWSEYIDLSKSRILVYNDFEEAMAYEPNRNNPIQYDIEMILKSFDSVKKIPEAIYEMLMFRKQYYFEQFLPALLRKPSGIPRSDGRLRLIEALKKAGKIPPNLYEVYKECNIKK